MCVAGYYQPAGPLITAHGHAAGVIHGAGPQVPPPVPPPSKPPLATLESTPSPTPPPPSQPTSAHAPPSSATDSSDNEVTLFSSNSVYCEWINPSIYFSNKKIYFSEIL